MDAHKLYSYQAQPSSASHSSVPAHSIATLPRITNTELRELVLQNHPSLAIIDVRDSDYIGGHIKGCTNVPSPNLDWQLPEVVRKNKDKEVVVFHCALSQQRGPSAALRYLRERDRLFPASEKKADDNAKSVQDNGTESNKPQQQQVYVLKGGFYEWQKKFGKDSEVTEDYRSELWENY